MGYNLIITPSADKDLNDIIQYMSNDLSNPNAAKRFYEKVEKSYANLEEFPCMYPLCELPRFSDNHRKIIIDDYVIVYRFDEISGTNYIIRVLYGKVNLLNSL